MKKKHADSRCFSFAGGKMENFDLKTLKLMILSATCKTQLEFDQELVE